MKKLTTIITVLDKLNNEDTSLFHYIVETQYHRIDLKDDCMRYDLPCMKDEHLDKMLRATKCEVKRHSKTGEKLRSVYTIEEEWL